MGETAVTERFLSEVWRRQLFIPEKLFASGEHVRVIRPGTASSDRGPDFRNAVVSINGGERRGDIEVHRAASDWRCHGHHQDPNYNGVILQVVWKGANSAPLQKGGMAPTLNISQCLPEPLEAVRDRVRTPVLPEEPCFDAVGYLGKDRLVAILHAAGEKRFRAKAEHFASTIDNYGPPDALYQGMMAALGYSRNKEAFEELARGLPLEFLAEVCRGLSFSARARTIAGLLLGRAGLLEASTDDESVKAWERLGDGRAMDRSCWDLFRVRPENHPVRRILGAASLLARSGVTGIAGMVRHHVERRNNPGRLESCFIVGPGPLSKGHGKLIGWARAREVVTNVALPFTFAWARLEQNGLLEQRVLEIYRRYPGGLENTATRRLGRLFWGDDRQAWNRSARLQQGLLHMHKKYCAFQSCVRCALSCTPDGRRTDNLRRGAACPSGAALEN